MLNSNLKLSELFLWNMADAYVLQCSGFPMHRIAEFDQVYQQMDESLFMNVCSLAESIVLEREDYSELIIPRAKLMELKAEIDLQFSDVSSDARQTFWSIISQYLWKNCSDAKSEIMHEKRFKDPNLGEFFKALEEAKRNGLFGK